MSSSSGTARVGAFAGLLAVLAIPAAVVAAQVLNGVVLLRALYVGVARGRRARPDRAPPRRAGPGSRRPGASTGAVPGAVRTARILAWAGLYAGVTGALALGVYGVLRLAQ